jgi:hypothetical protein
VNNIQDQLSQADPLNHVALHTLPDAAVKALAQEIVMHEQSSPAPIEQPGEVRARSPRRRRHRLMVGLVAGLIVVPTTAAAVAGGMHTGFFEPEPPEGLNSMATPGEEWLKSWEPEIVNVVKDLTTEFPLPAGVTYGPLLKRFPMTDEPDEKSLTQRTVLGQMVSAYAQCAWYQDWLKGDAKQRAADQPTIDAMPTNKYWRYATDDATGEGGGPESAIAAETRAGKTTMITQHIEANCLGKSPLPGKSPLLDSSHDRPAKP